MDVVSPPEAVAETLGFHCRPPSGDLLELAHAATRRVLGPFGIVGSCRQFPPVPGLPTVPVFVARGPRRGLGAGGPDERRILDLVGMGVSDEPEDARLKAIVEAVERYCFALPHDPTLVVRGAQDDFNGAAVPMERFRPFTDQQYQARPSLRFPRPSDPVDWAWAYSLTRECFALVPAQYAYVTVGFRPPNNFVNSVTSTGVSCHVSVEAALLAGLLEVVERDAIMLYWLNRRSPRHVSVDEDGRGDVARLLRDHFDLKDVEFSLLDITSDSGIPTICCRATSENLDRPSSTFGAASRLDPTQAVRKALFEAAQVLLGLHGLGSTATSSMPESEVHDIWDHARFYAGAESVERIAFLSVSTERVPLSQLANQATGDTALDLRNCVTRLAETGLEVFAVDLTSADVAAAGLHTVKVLVPGMLDINADARYPQLGSPRVRSVPNAMGWPVLDDTELNLAPCPMS